MSTALQQRTDRGRPSTDYSILAIRSADEDDGRLFPAPGGEAGIVALEPWDGEPLRISGSALRVSELLAGSWKTRQRVQDIEIDVLITDARLVVACSKFDEEGGRRGLDAGTAVAPVATGPSKAPATHRHHDKILVGQIRYAWLRCVGFKPRTSWGTNEEIQLGVAVKTSAGGTSELFLEVVLPKNVASSSVAQTIAKRAARYRLAYHTTEDMAERARYEELAEAQPLASPPPKKFALYQMPSYCYVNTASAHPQASTPM